MASRLSSFTTSQTFFDYVVTGFEARTTIGLPRWKQGHAAVHRPDIKLRPFREHAQEAHDIKPTAVNTTLR